MYTRGLLIFVVLILDQSLSANRPHKMNQVTAVRMEDDPRHKMVGVGCQVNGTGHRYVCVIDSGATYTVISDKVLKAEGPLANLTTANGVIRVHQREVSLTLANGMELKSQALVQSGLMPEGIDVLLGQDILRQFRLVVFDYENQQVEFHR